MLDYDGDLWPDVAVANDTSPNFLFFNRGDGTFEEIGVDSGMAYSESGAARGGMGIDTGDVDRDGSVDIVIGNFSQEMVAYFRSVESGYYIDDAAQVGIGIPTLMTLAFGLVHLLNFRLNDKLIEEMDGSIFGVVATTFRQSFLSVIFYVFAVCFLGVHLSHGFQSAFRTFGLRHPRFDRLVNGLGYIFAAVIAVGFASIPARHCWTEAIRVRRWFLGRVRGAT